VSRQEEALQRIKSRNRAADPVPLYMPSPEAPVPQSEQATPEYVKFEDPRSAPAAAEPEKPEQATPGGQPSIPNPRAPRRLLTQKIMANLIKVPDPENVDRNRVHLDPEEEAEVLHLPAFCMKRAEKTCSHQPSAETGTPIGSYQPSQDYSDGADGEVRLQPELSMSPPSWLTSTAHEHILRSVVALVGTGQYVQDPAEGVA
jgi:hypothetical protein